MSSTKYTLDRYEGDYAIFLMAENETITKIIHQSELNIELAEGDIVLIDDAQPPIHITLLQEETAAQREKISNMIEKLRNRK